MYFNQECLQLAVNCRSPTLKLINDEAIEAENTSPINKFDKGLPGKKQLKKRRTISDSPF